MFESYYPKKFCREFVQIKGSGQLVNIMATVKEIKPAMDDWVRVDRYDEYRRICKRYGLIVRTDTVFRMSKKKNILKNVIGGKRLTTTYAFGLPFNGSSKDGLVHVFIAKSKGNLENCFRDGWYPLIIKHRVIDRPGIDIFKFGYNLGYPKCCVGFFRQFNNWYKYSYLYEAFKNTKKNRYHYLSNPCTRDITYSYIYHMPCAYNCKATIELARKIKKAIYAEEPEFVEKIDRHLKLPLLIFYEIKFYAFDGEIKNGKLHYKDVYFIGQMSENNLYESDLKRGNCVFLEDRDVVILNNGKLIRRIRWQRRNFAPEIPFIVQFN